MGNPLREQDLFNKIRALPDEKSWKSKTLSTSSSVVTTIAVSYKPQPGSPKAPSTRSGTTLTTPSMTAYGFGDVVLVPFPFTDQTGTKKRPAAVISSSAYHRERSDVVLMAVTSQTGPLRNRRAVYPGMAAVRVPEAFHPETDPLYDSTVAGPPQAGAAWRERQGSSPAKPDEDPGNRDLAGSCLALTSLLPGPTFALATNGPQRSDR
jgi:hypothetical protein